MCYVLEGRRFPFGTNIHLCSFHSEHVRTPKQNPPDFRVVILLSTNSGIRSNKMLILARSYLNNRWKELHKRMKALEKAHNYCNSCVSYQGADPERSSTHAIPVKQEPEEEAAEHKITAEGAVAPEQESHNAAAVMNMTLDKKSKPRFPATVSSAPPVRSPGKLRRSYEEDYKG